MGTETELDSFYPYCFDKSDKLTGMGSRQGTRFMRILMDEFEDDKNES